MNNNYINENKLDDYYNVPKIGNKKENNYLKIHLDRSLQKNNLYKKLEESKSFEKELFEHNKNLYKGETVNGLVNGFLLAYNYHLPLCIRPDDIQGAILLVFTTFVNNNAEKFRHLFVNHEGKKELTVNLNKFDITEFSKIIVDKIIENTKSPELIECLSTNYGISNPITKTVFQMLTCNSMKEYYSFRACCMCGIPAIVLKGTKDDWNKLNKVYNTIRNFITSIENNELTDWIPHMDNVMKMFVDLRDLAESGEVDAPDNYKELWKRVISYVSYGSGGDTNLGGWISILSPYTNDNTIRKSAKFPCFDINNELPPSYSGRYNNVVYDDDHSSYFEARNWSSVQHTMSQTPIKISYDNGATYNNFTVHAGLFALVHVNENEEVEFNFSCFVNDS